MFLGCVLWSSSAELWMKSLTYWRQTHGGYSSSGKRYLTRNSSKEKYIKEAQEKPAPEAGSNHLRTFKSTTGIWKSAVQVGQHLQGKLIPLMAKWNTGKGLTHFPLPGFIWTQKQPEAVVTVEVGSIRAGLGKNTNSGHIFSL